MGLFNWIKDFEYPCPHCGHILKDFQTKDSFYHELFCNAVPFWDARNFYASCGKCGTWVEFKLKQKDPRYTLADYDLITELPAIEN